MAVQFDPFIGKVTVKEIDKGTAQGQMVFWNDTNKVWDNTETTELFWDDTNKRLGIGTATPGQALDVFNGRARIREYGTASNDYAVLEFGNALYDLVGGFFLGGSGATGYAGANSMNIFNIRAYPLALGTTNLVRLFIEADGDIGINTTTPRAKLDILDASNPQLRLTHTDASVYTDLQTNSSGHLYINPSGGNVGIGTATPSYRLDVVGNDAAVPFRVQYASTTEGLPANLPLYTTSLFVRNNTNAYANIATYIGGSNSYTGLTFGDKDHYASGSISYYNSDDSMRFVTSVAERMRIESGGNVGIGTTDPDRKLDVLDASNPQLRLTHTDNSVYTDLQATSSGHLYINPSGGNVGIGTAIPGKTLEVNGDIDCDNVYLPDSGKIFGSIPANDYYGFSSGSISIAARGNATILIDSNNADTTRYFRILHDSVSELFRVQENGNVGIGTTGPDRKLEVLDASNPQLRLTHTDASVYTDFQTDSSGRLSISPSGTGNQVILNATPGAYNATPTLSFGDGDTGFYENADDSIAVSIFGVNRFFFTTQYLRGAAADRFDIDHTQGISSTVPIYSFRGDNDTGINRAAADQLSLIAGGVEGIRITEATSISINMGLADSDKTYWGAGSDMSIYYDGTSGYIKTSDVAASDLHITTGTAKTIVYDTPVYDDLNFDPTRSGGPVATRPDSVTINNVFHTEFTSANNQLCGSVAELPHKYKLSTDLTPHCHIFLKSGESSGTTGVTFTFYWELRQSTGITSGNLTLSATSAELAGATGGTKFDISGAAFSGSAELGAQLAVTIARTAGDAGDVVVTTYGVHYQIDTPGSRQITTK